MMTDVVARSIFDLTDQERKDRRARYERYRRQLPVMQAQARRLQLPDRIGRSMAGRLTHLAARKGLSHISELRGCTLDGARNVGIKTVAFINALWPDCPEPPIGRVH